MFGRSNCEYLYVNNNIHSPEGPKLKNIPKTPEMQIYLWSAVDWQPLSAKIS